jgi:hypothetical protein
MQERQLEDKDLQQTQLVLLRKIETHLASITGEVIKEEDTNES